MTSHSSPKRRICLQACLISLPRHICQYLMTHFIHFQEEIGLIPRICKVLSWSLHFCFLTAANKNPKSFRSKIISADLPLSFYPVQPSQHSNLYVFFIFRGCSGTLIRTHHWTLHSGLKSGNLDYFKSSVKCPLSNKPPPSNTPPPLFRGRKLKSPPPPLRSPNYSSLINDRLY